MKGITTTIGLPMAPKEYSDSWATALVGKLNEVLFQHAWYIQNQHQVLDWQWSPSGTFTPASADVYENLPNLPAMTFDAVGENSTLICICELSAYANAADTATFRFTRSGTIIGSERSIYIADTAHNSVTFLANGNGVPAGSYTMAVQVKTAAQGLRMNTSDKVHFTVIELRK